MLQQGEPKDDPLRLAAWGRGVKAAGNNGSGLFPKMSLPAHLQGLLASNNSNSTSPEEQVSKARPKKGLVSSPKLGLKSEKGRAIGSETYMTLKITVLTIITTLFTGYKGNGPPFHER